MALLQGEDLWSPLLELDPVINFVIRADVTWNGHNIPSLSGRYAKSVLVLFRFKKKEIAMDSLLPTYHLHDILYRLFTKQHHLF